VTNGDAPAMKWSREDSRDTSSLHEERYTVYILLLVTTLPLRRSVRMLPSGGCK
jgi:hypothetical protein